jgi:RHS repeat-associated protein
VDLENNINWEEDAKYVYYDHGPLARVELGDKKLQGYDYVYSIQGWLKGVNSTVLDANHDPGKDGDFNQSSFPADLMGFNLHYFENDYKAIDITKNANATAFFADYQNSHVATNSKNLYNGNIRSMQTTLRDMSTGNQMPMANAYKYDQLNRLVESKSFESLAFNASGNTWTTNGPTDHYENRFSYDANGNILSQSRKNQSGDYIDSLVYRYQESNGKRIRNRLYHLNDAVATNDESDLENMGVFTPHSIADDINEKNNYRYDREGRLTRDSVEGLTIIWRVDGKIKKIVDDTVNQPSAGAPQKHKFIEFDYDAMGNRIAKHTYDSLNGLLKSTYYILDAQGNTLSTYEHAYDGNTSFAQTEKHIYGSSRLGLQNERVDLLSPAPLTLPLSTSAVGHKLYEMSNHLGNVLSVYKDVLLVSSSSGGLVPDQYTLVLASVTDYSPFGVTLDGRTQSSSSYRYGFQGQESDDEVKGAGNSVNYKYRMHDPRVGRFFAVDPLAGEYPWNSTYAFSENIVISAVELEGLEAQDAIWKADPYGIMNSNVWKGLKRTGMGYMSNGPRSSDPKVCIECANSNGQNVNSFSTSWTVNRVNGNLTLSKDPTGFKEKSNFATGVTSQEVNNFVKVTDEEIYHMQEIIVKTYKSDLDGNITGYNEQKIVVEERVQVYDLLENKELPKGNEDFYINKGSLERKVSIGSNVSLPFPNSISSEVQNKLKEVKQINDGLREGFKREMQGQGYKQIEDELRHIQDNSKYY